MGSTRYRNPRVAIEPSRYALGFYMASSRVSILRRSHGLGVYTTKNKNPLHVRAHTCYRMCATECNAEVGGSVLQSVVHIPVQNVYMPVTDMYTDQ